MEMLGRISYLKSRAEVLQQIKSSTCSSSSNDEKSIVLQEEVQPISFVEAPIVSSYNDRVRPLLDAVDKLRHLKVMKEGIQLPTIVVVGDQSSGKSSVLESLAGINLPRGQGICTRVPLIMRLQNHPCPETELSLEFLGKTVPTDETHISDSINFATIEIAGEGKKISHTPLTLHVKKKGVPDLTMVDLPGITRVPIHGQPQDIYEQISTIIMEYISPEESIILNVLSATVDFPTCESIRMSQKVDNRGERTLAVVTKVDKSPEGLLEKVTADDVNIGLGYVCVRNRIGDESYQEAREEEAKLFESHPLLSKIDKSIVGIPVLAQKLVQIQAISMAKCLPEIVSKINERLSSYISELNKMPKNMSSVAEALTAFMRIVGSAKESLRKILLRSEFDEYPYEISMHCTARLAEMLNQYADELHKCADDDAVKDFLMEEIALLEEVKGIALPNFIPRTAFLTILQRKVKGISVIPIDFACQVWNYMEDVVISVLMKHSENYPQLQSATRRAAHNLIAKMKESSINRVTEIVEMERLTDYTCNPEYMSEWQKLLGQQDKFISEVFSNYPQLSSDNLEVFSNYPQLSSVNLEGFGEVRIEHLRQYQHVKQIAHQAFDMKMRITAYWKIVLGRLVDSMALHLQWSVNNLVDKEMEKEIVGQLLAGPQGAINIEQMLEESPLVVGKRERLNMSIDLLKESKDILGNIMDRIAFHGD